MDVAVFGVMDSDSGLILWIGAGIALNVPSTSGGLRRQMGRVRYNKRGPGVGSNTISRKDASPAGNNRSAS